MYLDYIKILHFIFPPSPDEKLLQNCTQEEFSHLYHIRNLPDVYALLPYQDDRVRSAIHLAKFHNHTHAQKLLASVLAQHIVDTYDDNLVCIPIPLSKKRKRSRGYNQVVNILKHVQKKYPSITCDNHSLVRNRDTRPQTSLDKAKRLTNVRDAFSVTDPQKIVGKKILLIDDVTTTGATLRAAKAALVFQNPLSITCIAIAH